MVYLHRCEYIGRMFGIYKAHCDSSPLTHYSRGKLVLLHSPRKHGSSGTAPSWKVSLPLTICGDAHYYSELFTVIHNYSSEVRCVLFIIADVGKFFIYNY